MAIDNHGQTKQAKDPLVLLAQTTIDQYVSAGTTPTPPQLPEDLPSRAGCFVTINTHSTGNLRGCIGTIVPTQPTLAQEVIENAISASTRDPRFPPIAVDELDDLDVKVDVLFPPEPAKISDLDPACYGVIVTQGMRRGLLLPDLEGVDSADEQIKIACMKAGINPASSFVLEKFRVDRHI